MIRAIWLHNLKWKGGFVYLLYTHISIAIKLFTHVKLSFGRGPIQHENWKSSLTVMFAGTPMHTLWYHAWHVLQITQSTFFSNLAKLSEHFPHIRQTCPTSLRGMLTLGLTLTTIHVTKPKRVKRVKCQLTSSLRFCWNQWNYMVGSTTRNSCVHPHNVHNRSTSKKVKLIVINTYWQLTCNPEYRSRGAPSSYAAHTLPTHNVAG